MINMSRIGAAGWDKVAPGFLSDFCLSTPLPTGLIELMRFLWIGQDGCTVWMLHERSRQHVCLMHLPVPLFEGIKKEATPVWNANPPECWQFYDVRFPMEKPLTGHQANPILDNIKTVLQSTSPECFINHASWIVRLTCLCHHAITTLNVKQLACDTDVWVRTIASRMI